MIVLSVFWLLFALAAIMPLQWSLTLLFVSLPFDHDPAVCSPVSARSFQGPPDYT
jgi:hypothetical protein